MDGNTIPGGYTAQECFSYFREGPIEYNRKDDKLAEQPSHGESILFLWRTVYSLGNHQIFDYQFVT